MIFVHELHRKKWQMKLRRMDTLFTKPWAMAKLFSIFIYLFLLAKRKWNGNIHSKWRRNRVDVGIQSIQKRISRSTCLPVYGWRFLWFGFLIGDADCEQFHFVSFTRHFFFFLFSFQLHTVLVYKMLMRSYFSVGFFFIFHILRLRLFISFFRFASNNPVLPVLGSKQFVAFISSVFNSFNLILFLVQSIASLSLLWDIMLMMRQWYGTSNAYEIHFIPVRRLKTPPRCVR